MRSTLLLLLFTISASLLISVLVWRPLLTENCPTTPPLTVDERRYGPGFDCKAVAVLEKRLPAPLRIDAGFEDVIASLRDGRNIFINWRSVEAVGISRQAAVHVDVGGMRFDDALTKILHSAAGGAAQLSFTCDEGGVTIATKDDLSINTMTRVYDVRDFAPPTPVMPSTDGRGQVLFTSPLLTPAPVLALEAQLCSTIDPPSWRETGGSVGSIRILGANLIINQTPTNHHNIIRLLERARWHRDLRAFAHRAAVLVGISVTFVLAARMLWLWRRDIVRRREGLCHGCGYDLRASRDRCPECGRPVALAALIAPPAS